MSNNKFLNIKEIVSQKEIRFNKLSLKYEYRDKNNMSNQFQELNEDNLKAELYEQGYNGFDNMLSTLLRSDFTEKYDPIIGYFENLEPYNEEEGDVIIKTANFVRVDNDEQDWFNLMFKKMLVRCIACALNIISFNKQCLTFIGKQNDGKSTFIEFLCPKELIEYYTDKIDIHNKDGRIALCQNFIINLDEIGGLSNYELNKTKAFMSMSKIKERLPYDKRATSMVRRASFFASANSDEFLSDETGSVRWLVFKVKEVIHDNGGNKGYNQNINIDRVWAQAYYLLKNGFSYNLNKEELARSENNNRKFYITSVEQELIQNFFSPASKAEKDIPGVEFILPMEIVKIIQFATPSKICSKRTRKALIYLGFEKEKGYVEKLGQTRDGYFVIRNPKTR